MNEHAAFLMGPACQFHEGSTGAAHGAGWAVYMPGDDENMRDEHWAFACLHHAREHDGPVVRLLDRFLPPSLTHDLLAGFDEIDDEMDYTSEALGQIVAKVMAGSKQQEGSPQWQITQRQVRGELEAYASDKMVANAERAEERRLQQ